MAYIIDEAKGIINLRKWKYLKPYTYKTGTVSWNRNGMKTSTMSIIVKMQKDKGVLILDYKCNGTKYNYNIKIISKPSNLGKGNVFYFVCPFTFKTCRKLHFYNEHFIHRIAIKGGMYSKQIESKKYRQLDRIYGSYFKSEKYYEILYSKNFKRSYKGKPTKRYLKLMAKINEGKSFSSEDIERLLLFGV